MRTSFIILLGIIVDAYCQRHYQSPQQAAILSDVRYLAGDGTFGAAYSQEDGVEFKEESDVNGDRRGSYSYIDPNGQRHTVSYTAGRNGFRVTEDHIPTAPTPAPPQPEYAPLPQYNPPDYQPPSYASPPQQYSQHYQPAYEPQPVVYQPQLRPQYQYRSQPQSRYHHPPELQAIPSHRGPGAYYQLQPQLQPQPQPQPQSEPEPQPLPLPRPRPRPAPHYNAITTPTPRNFYPPGKLDFNRTPDGFSYTFNKT